MADISLDTLTVEERQLSVARVLASRTFSKSVRLSQFLDFICRLTLEGRAQDINEQQIGIHIFGRPHSYNPGDDSIVRTQARILRQRLEEYFEHECPWSPVVILIPKGGYVPVFERRALLPGPVREVRPNPSIPKPTPEPPSTLVSVVPESIAPAAPATNLIAAFAVSSAPPALYRVHPALYLLAALLFMAIGVLLDRAPRLVRSAAPTSLWTAIFTSGRPVVMVPSDDGLVLSEEYRQAPISLEEYLSGTYMRTASPANLTQIADPVARPLTPAWLFAHQYTSTADLNLALRLDRLSQAAGTTIQTRYARSLRLDDLKSNNVILIGGVGANPWVALFANQLNFNIDYDWKTGQGYVENKAPRQGEQQRYLDKHGPGVTSSFGVLAYVPGLGGGGSALLFEGSGMAGTEAAADFPFNQDAFGAFLKQIGANPRKPIPYFELLLETRSVGGNAPRAQVIAWRRLPSESVMTSH